MKRYISAEREDPLNLFDHPSEAMETKSAKKEIKNQYVDWLMSFEPPWKVFGHLTFRDDIAQDVALSKFYGLVRYLNEKLFGKHYTNIVGHSYFSYVVCYEYQIRQVLHFHFLANRPIDTSIARRYWYTNAGISKITRIKNLEQTVHYCLKYVTKNNEPEVYKTKRVYEPPQYPIWWFENLPSFKNGNE